MKRPGPARRVLKLDFIKIGGRISEMYFHATVLPNRGNNL
jgi:hypothetical protein